MIDTTRLSPLMDDLNMRSTFPNSWASVPLLSNVRVQLSHNLNFSFVTRHGYVYSNITIVQLLC